MKTVRLSQDLKWTIEGAARNKFDNINPLKEYPDSGYDILTDHNIITKTQRSIKEFEEVWDMPMPLQTATAVNITSKYDFPPDEDGYVETSNRSYTFDIPDTRVPEMICRYDVIKLIVEPDNKHFVECISIQNYNEALNEKKSDQRRSLNSVMERFSTLNQLLKAAPYLKDLVPQDKITKMHEVDDRSGRRKELAELADGELQDMRETLLEDSLLGDI